MIKSRIRFCILINCITNMLSQDLIPLPHVFFSNQLEVLCQQLKHQLFLNSHPFTRRMVIVPSPAIKSWLMFQLAKEGSSGIAAGVDFGFIDPGLNSLFQLLSLDPNNLPDPSELELCLAIELEIVNMVKTFSGFSLAEKEVWEPLLLYLHIDHTKLDISKRTSKRITALSGKLSRYFLDYGKFGGKIIEAWNHTSALHWQQALWQRLEGLFALWNYPYRKFEGLSQCHPLESQELQVHLFGLSYLAPVHHRFLIKAAQYVPVNYYLLSPCQKFWSDLLSNKEGAGLKSYWRKRGVCELQQQDLDNYLMDNNPLLANFGKLGRKMSQQIEESHFQTFEDYVLPKSVLDCESYSDLLDDEPHLANTGHRLTMLEALQADIILLRNPDTTQAVYLEEYDKTIQVHAAPKPMREVESIYNALMDIIDRHKQGNALIAPSDIIVMAPNIAEYAPFIHSVFGSAKSALEYQLMDLEMPSHNRYVQAFLHLLKLPLGRWEASSLLRLFEFQVFQDKHRLTLEDVQHLRKWIKAADIRWGKDHQHRNELLKRDHCNRLMVEENEESTWDHGLGRLLEGLAMFSGRDLSESSEVHYFPIDKVESTQGDLLGKIVQLIGSLLEDLRPLNDGTELSLKEWSLYLKCLCDTYFSSGIDEEAEAGYRELIHQFELFEKVMPQLHEAAYPFHTIQKLLEQALNKMTVNLRESHVQCVRFCSLLPMRSIPAKVIGLMGMNDGAFPRADEQAKLNYLLHHPDADYIPSQIDFDRYLFLEAILSARNYLLFSYVTQEKGDSKEQLPSLVITELLAYLDKAYSLPIGAVSQSYLFKHALLPFDKRYFSENSICRSYIKSHFEAAKAVYLSPKQKTHQFISACNIAATVDENAQDLIIELNDLMAFARNPLKVYFNQSLGIFLEKEDERVLPTQEEWQLSHLNAALVSREALFSDLPKTLLHAKKMGKLPSGPFQEIGVERIKQDVESLRVNLQSLEIDPKQLFSIEFSERYSHPHCSGDSWQLPSLSIVTPRGIHVKLVGRFETVSHKGLVHFGEDSIKEVVKSWPALLTLCCLIQTYNLPINGALLFIKGKTSKIKETHVEDVNLLLGKYVDYFLDASKTPSPLLPEWVAPILSGESKELQELVGKYTENSFQPVYDDYLKWMGRNSANLDTEATVQHWQSTAQSLFGDIN